MVAVLLCFGLAALKSTFSVLKALGLVWQFCLEPENSTGWVGEETGLVGDTTNLLYLHFCSLHDHVWIGRRQFSVINLEIFFFMLLASVWFPNHSGNTLSGENWSSKKENKNSPAKHLSSITGEGEGSGCTVQGKFWGNWGGFGVLWDL